MFRNCRNHITDWYTSTFTVSECKPACSWTSALHTLVIKKESAGPWQLGNRHKNKYREWWIDASRKASCGLNNTGGKKERTQSRRQKEERLWERILPCPVLFLWGSLLTLTSRVKRPCDTAELVCVLSHGEIIWGECTGVSCIAEIISTETLACDYPRLQRKYQDGCVKGPANTRIHHLFLSY